MHKCRPTPACPSGGAAIAVEIEPVTGLNVSTLKALLVHFADTQAVGPNAIATILERELAAGRLTRRPDGFRVPDEHVAGRAALFAEISEHLSGFAQAKLAWPAAAFAEQPKTAHARAIAASGAFFDWDTGLVIAQSPARAQAVVNDLELLDSRTVVFVDDHIAFAMHDLRRLGGVIQTTDTGDLQVAFADRDAAANGLAVLADARRAPIALQHNARLALEDGIGLERFGLGPDDGPERIADVVARSTRADLTRLVKEQADLAFERARLAERSETQGLNETLRERQRSLRDLDASDSGRTSDRYFAQADQRALTDRSFADRTKPAQRGGSAYTDARRSEKLADRSPVAHNRTRSRETMNAFLDEARGQEDVLKIPRLRQETTLSEPGATITGAIAHLTDQHALVVDRSGRYAIVDRNDITRQRIGAPNRAKWHDAGVSKALLKELGAESVAVTIGRRADGTSLSLDAENPTTVRNARERENESIHETITQNEVERERTREAHRLVDEARRTFTGAHELRPDAIGAALLPEELDEGIGYRGVIVARGTQLQVMICSAGLDDAGRRSWRPVLHDRFAAPTEDLAIGEIWTLTYPAGANKEFAEAIRAPRLDDRVREFVARMEPLDREALNAERDLNVAIAINIVREQFGIARPGLYALEPQTLDEHDIPSLRVAGEIVLVSPNLSYLFTTDEHQRFPDAIVPLEHHRLGRTFDIGDRAVVHYDRRTGLAIAKHERVELSAEAQQEFALTDTLARRADLLGQSFREMARTAIAQKLGVDVDALRALNLERTGPVAARTVLTTSHETYFVAAVNGAMKLCAVPTYDEDGRRSTELIQALARGGAELTSTAAGVTIAPFPHTVEGALPLEEHTLRSILPTRREDGTFEARTLCGRVAGANDREVVVDLGSYDYIVLDRAELAIEAQDLAVRTQLFLHFDGDRVEATRDTSHALPLLAEKVDQTLTIVPPMRQSGRSQAM